MGPQPESKLMFVPRLTSPQKAERAPWVEQQLQLNRESDPLE
jgi:hypothetical protein